MALSEAAAPRPAIPTILGELLRRAAAAALSLALRPAPPAAPARLLADAGLHPAELEVEAAARAGIAPSHEVLRFGRL